MIHHDCFRCLLPSRPPPPSSPLQLYIHHSLYLNVGGLGKRIVSSPSFHGRPRNDFVEVVGQDHAGGQLKVWYCQTLLLFRFGWDGNAHNVAYIRWCKALGNSETITALSDKYQVISIESIKDQAFLAPDFNKGGNHLRVDKLVKRYEDKKQSQCCSAVGCWLLLLAA